MNFNWIKEYLKVGTPQSSMRLVMIWGFILVSIVFIAISTHIIIMSSKANLKSIDWVGIAALVVALGGFITPLLVFKNAQYKEENKTLS